MTAMQKRDVMFVIHSLRMGGAERMLAILANALAAEGTRVRVLTLASRGEPPFYPLDPGVHVEDLGLAGKSRSWRTFLADGLTGIMALRRALLAARPGIVISFMHNTNTSVLLALSATGGNRMPVIVSERTNPRQGPRALGWRVLRRLAYPRAAAVVVQNDRCAEYFRFLQAAKVKVIPNPVLAPAAQPGSFPRESVILGVGRLDPVKRFDLLIKAFHLVAPRLPGWTLALHGEGSERGKLERLIAELGMGDRVKLMGVTRDMHGVMLRSSIFALTSRYEGFPNALSEAMACGMAVVAADCETGPRELVTPGVDGLLVSSRAEALVEEMGEALLRLAGDPEARRVMGEAAAHIVTRHAPKHVLARWKILLAEISGREGEAST